MKYAAFLRGINVGGNKIIKMKELKKIFNSMKLKDIETILQSGNVLFESTEKEELLCKKIETQLQKSLGFEVKIFLRTIPEIEKILKQNPFKQKKLETNEYIYITFLSGVPEKKLKDSLIASGNELDIFQIIGREVFAFNLKDEKKKNVFSNNFVEKILKVSATTRNIQTLNRIVEKQ
ncbi:MAG: DUF1697 domain-containing protein [archaeon]|nr:DUF1697 domain-containing protein [archaeon]